MTRKKWAALLCKVEGKKSQVKIGDMEEILKRMVQIEAAHKIRLELEGSAPISILFTLDQDAEKVAQKQLKKMKLAKKKK